MNLGIFSRGGATLLTAQTRDSCHFALAIFNTPAWMGGGEEREMGVFQKSLNKNVKVQKFWGTKFHDGCVPVISLVLSQLQVNKCDASDTESIQYHILC